MKGSDDINTMKDECDDHFSEGVLTSSLRVGNVLLEVMQYDLETPKKLHWSKIWRLKIKSYFKSVLSRWNRYSDMFLREAFKSDPEENH